MEGVHGAHGLDPVSPGLGDRRAGTSQRRHRPRQSVDDRGYGGAQSLRLMIAATSPAHGARLVTANVEDVQHLGGLIVIVPAK